MPPCACCSTSGAAGLVVGAGADAAGRALGRAGPAHAMMQTDLKRLLAYSTVENIGVDLRRARPRAGLSRPTGCLRAQRWPSRRRCCTRSTTPLFKSLLFMGAGAVLHATGERDMERLGGLIHRLPRDQRLLPGRCRRDLGPAAAQRLRLGMAAVPGDPGSPQLPSGFLRFLAPAVGGLLALAAALAAACFVRAYGIAFLGRPRSDAAGAAHEVDAWSRGRDARCRCLVRAVRRVPGAGHRPAGPRSGRAGRRAAAGQGGQGWLSLVPVDARAQLLQRPDPARVHRHLGERRPLRPPLRARRLRARPGLGLRLPRSVVGHPVHRVELRPADAPRLR